MSETKNASAVAEFLHKRGVTRCPSACVLATQGKVTEADRLELRKYQRQGGRAGQNASFSGR